MIDLVVAFVLFIFMLVVLLCFLCCYRFSVNKDLYKGSFIEMLQVSGGRG